MACVSITPEIEGNVYYLLFEISKQEEKSFIITRYTLDQDAQADLLADFLPHRVQIVQLVKIDLLFHGVSEVIIDPRVHTDEGQQLCKLFYQHILDAVAKTPAPPPKKLWWQKKD